MNWNCPNLAWKGRVLTLSFNARLKRTLGSEDPKVQKWSDKAQNMAWRSADPSQIEIFD